MSKSLQAMRSEYAGQPFTEEAVDDDPFRQFDRWFNEAVTAEIPDTNAMVLSTSGADGMPSGRVVLLKGIEDGGFVFYTNYGSSKGKALASNPRASLLFFWQQLARQVRVSGAATRVSRDMSAAYCATRPRESQLAAWASAQSEIIADRAALERAFDQARERFGDGPIPLPDTWGGYMLIPDRFEFWQGRPSRLHDRIEYREVNGRWHRSRLAP